MTRSMNEGMIDINNLTMSFGQEFECFTRGCVQSGLDFLHVTMETPAVY